MVETKKASVTGVQGNGTWESKYGTMYKFEISFDNGDSGEYSCKSPTQDKFVQGQSVDYTISSREYNGNTYYTIKPVSTYTGGSGYGGKSDPDKDRRIAKLAVLKSATELVCNEKVMARDLFTMADKMMEWVYGDDKVDVPTNTTKAQVSKPAEPQQAFAKDDDLPF